MTCHACGNELRQGSRFCGNCGAERLPGPDELNPSVAQAPIPQATIAQSILVPPTAAPYAAPPQHTPLMPSSVVVAPSRRPTVYVAALVAVVALVAGGIVAGSTLFGGDGSISGGDASEVSTAQSTQSPTTPASTLPELSPEEALALSLASWADIAGSSGSAVESTSAELVDGMPTGVLIDTQTGTTTVWNFSSDAGWFETDLVPLEWSPGTSFLNEIRLVDLTGDGSAEVFVNYYPYNDNLGVVFTLRSGSWTGVAYGEALSLNSDNSLSGSENTCVPDCASGPRLSFTLRWNGSSFSRQDTDDFGNPIEVYIKVGCVGDYRPRDYAPLQKCDKGESVRQLQAALDYFGFLITSDNEPPAIDGYFGKDTATSVRLYQLYLGIPVTGVADGSWYYQLIEAYNMSVYGIGG